MAILQFYGEKHPYNFFLPPAQARQFAVLPVSFTCFSPALARVAGAGRGAGSDRKGPKSNSKTQPCQMGTSARQQKERKTLGEALSRESRAVSPCPSFARHSGRTTLPHLGLIEVFHTHTIHGGSQIPRAICLRGREETWHGYQLGGMQLPQNLWSEIYSYSVNWAQGKLSKRQLEKFPSQICKIRFYLLLELLLFSKATPKVFGGFLKT